MTTLGTDEQKSVEGTTQTLTVTQVRAWEPATLTTRGETWSAQAAKLTTFDDTQYRAVDASRDFWTGSAADAMRTRHDEIRTTTKTFIAALQDGSTAARTGAGTLESAKAAVVNAVQTAEGKGYEIGDDGTATISASTHQTLLSQLPDASSYTVAAGALQVDADASTAAVKQALENARTAALSVAGEIEKAFAQLPDGGSLMQTQLPSGGAVLTDPNGIWVIDTSKELSSPTVPAGAVVPDFIDRRDHNLVGGWTTVNAAQPAQPDAVKATMQEHYRFRYAGLEGTQQQMVVEKDGKYYLSRYYTHSWDMQQDVSATVHQAPGHDIKMGGTRGDWKTVDAAELQAVKDKYPNASFQTPTLPTSGKPGTATMDNGYKAVS